MSQILYAKGYFERLDVTEYFYFQFNPETMDDSREVEYAVTKPIQSEQPLYEHISAGERTVKFQLFLNGLEDASGYIGASNIKKKNLFDNIAGRALEGAIGIGAKLLPFSEGIGTAAGVLNSYGLLPEFLGGTQMKPNPPVPQRNVLNDIDFLDELLHGKGDKPPPEIRFHWEGYRNSRWIVTGLNFTTTMWDKNLFPLHVKVDITLKETFRSLSRKKETLSVARASQGRIRT